MKEGGTRFLFEHVNSPDTRTHRHTQIASEFLGDVFVHNCITYVYVHIMYCMFMYIYNILYVVSAPGRHSKHAKQ